MWNALEMMPEDELTKYVRFSQLLVWLRKEDVACEDNPEVTAILQSLRTLQAEGLLEEEPCKPQRYIEATAKDKKKECTENPKSVNLWRLRWITNKRGILALKDQPWTFPDEDKHVLTKLPEILEHLLKRGDLLKDWCGWSKEMSDDPKTFQLEAFIDGDILQVFAALPHTTLFDYDWHGYYNSKDEKEREDRATGRTTRGSGVITVLGSDSSDNGPDSSDNDDNHDSGSDEDSSESDDEDDSNSEDDNSESE